MKNDQYYESVRSDLLSLLPIGTTTVLDVGCGSGATAQKLTEMGIKEIVGIEVNPEMASKAGKCCLKVIVGDLETMSLDLPNGHFNTIIMADVLEHLREPYKTVTRLLPLLKKNGSVLVSIPNVTHYHVLKMLCSGRWEYAERGIMDETHLRFFTKKTFVKQMEKAGLQLVELIRNYRLLENDMIFGAGFAKILGPIVPNELLTFQYLMRFKMVEKK
jgi:2-polyprenyl-3-methyl-5-hydroxy-6-metoxy-1,4-benzoquinol methylase